MTTFLDILKETIKPENIVGSTVDTLTFRMTSTGFEDFRVRIHNGGATGPADRRAERFQDKLERGTFLSKINPIISFIDYNLSEGFGQPIARGNKGVISVLVASKMDHSLKDLYDSVKTQIKEQTEDKIEDPKITQLIYLKQLNSYPQESWNGFCADLKAIKQRNLYPYISMNNIMTDEDGLKLRPSGVEVTD